MAGISLVKNSGGLLSKSPEIKNALDSLNHLNNYSSYTAILEDRFFIGWNIYSEYPIRNFESGDWYFVIEGRVYNKPDLILEKELSDLLNNFSESKLKNWLLSTDGDFIIYCYNKNLTNLYIFNDILGRLPLYYKKNNNEILVSRYARFILEVQGEAEFDKIGMGEFLLFGYLIGERTLFKNISQLRPASLIVSDNSGTTIKTIINFNFEIREHKNKSFNEVASDVSELFSKACLDRFNNENTNLIALSSGMDSRTVAACLAKHKIPFKTATMVFSNGAAKEETAIAKQIAELFNAEWNPVLLTPPKGKDVHTLLRLKEGMNYLATAFLLPFYQQLENTYGKKINFITGDKGDKVTLSHDNPIHKFSSINELRNYILGEHAMLSLDEVCSIIDVKKDDILNDLDALLNSYPEQDISQRYTHFRAIEKSHKLAFQSDDRHKKFYWSYCPLTSSPFVNYLFNCSDEQKKMHKLFIALLQSYSPEAAKIVYTNFKAPITSVKGKLFMAAVYYLYPKTGDKMRGAIKNIFFGGNPVIDDQSIFYKCIDEQLNNSAELKKYFKTEKSSQLKNYRMTMLQSVFTLTSLIDDYSTNGSTLKKYYDEEFDHMS